MKKIYLDHSATTPVDKRVLAAMLPYFNKHFGNASSLHGFGQAAANAVATARGQVALFLNCQTDEIIFTSGATESDNLAIKGVVEALRQKTGENLHIITSAIEHPAVLEPLAWLANSGVAVTYLPVDRRGLVKISDFKKAIRNNTVLASIMYVNSEVGSIQPIRQIARLIKNERARRTAGYQTASGRGQKPVRLPIFFHTDAVQAVNFLNCDVKYLGVDLLSLSGHKIYGPKGIGALFVKNGTPLTAQQLGGHHENNQRSGTLNVPAIVGLGQAIKLLDKQSVAINNKKIADLRKLLIAGIKRNIPQAVLNTYLKQATPAHAHFSFLGAEGESILIALDLADIAVSTGSACAAGDLKPSHVLLAMGIKEEVAHNSIRFTLGRDNTKTEINYIIKNLPPIIRKLRKMAP